MNTAFSAEEHKTTLHLLLLLLYGPLDALCQSSKITNVGQTSNNTSPNTTFLQRVPGCGVGLHPVYRYLCDRRAAWGIVLQTLASSGFLFSMILLIGLLLWLLWKFASSRNQLSTIGGTVASMSLFLLSTAGIFAITFAFIVQLTPATCPSRLFVFSVLFSLAFSCLLARCLALMGFAAARDWGEPAVALGLFVVQVIISTEWLILVMVRDSKPCEYSRKEFVMLQIFVLCLLAISCILSLHLLCRPRSTYSYSYAAHTQSRHQAILLCLTLLLSAAVWVVWITMLVWGNDKLGRQPQWDDPLLCIALVTNGWVLLLGHGLSQVSFLCRGEARSKDVPLQFAGWTTTNMDSPEVGMAKQGQENSSYETEDENWRGRRTDPRLQSPYESEFSMTEIDPNKDYTIPRPETTNYRQPYDDYYGPI